MILRGLGLLAAIGWLLSAVGWVRVFNAGGDDLRLEAVRQTAPIMAVASILTAAAAAAFVW
jgi:hypothetical protein